jgi:hypothetical protein
LRDYRCLRATKYDATAPSALVSSEDFDIRN